MTDYQPRHRKHALTKTRPRLQRPGKHRGVEEEQVRAIVNDEFGQMLYEATVGNPFRRLS